MTTFPRKPFRFGVQVSSSPDRSAWVEQARRIEDLGYDIATMPDHFGDQLAPVPAMQAMLDATTNLRVSALVFDNDYKHPVVLAKELATMDVLSDGRVEIGLGAGWMISDYEQAGMQYDRPGVRIDRFVEGLSIIKQAMSPGAFSFEGEHYTITNYDGLPKPLQSLPPVIIGGGGPRVLTIAANEADIVGVNGNMHAGVVGPDAIASMTGEVIVEKVAIVAAAAEAAGRLDHIEMNIRAFMVSVTDDRAEQVAGIAALLGVDEQMIENSPFALIGSPAKIAEDIVARRDKLGFSYIIVGPDEIDSFAPVVAELAGT